MDLSRNPLADLSLVHPELLRQLFEIPGRMARHMLMSPRMHPPERVRYGDHRRQYMLVWENPRPKRHSVLFFVHGGAWRNGFPGMYPDVTAFFLKQGFHVVMPAYRLSPRFHHTHMMADMVSAIHAVRGWTHERGWGNTPILLSGSSAGATLTAHLAFDQRRRRDAGLDDGSITGFLSIAGPLDLDHLPPFQALESYAGGEKGSDAFQEANPVNHLAPDEKLPALITHCPEDAIVPYPCSASFVERYPAKEAIELWTINGRTHLDAMRFAHDNPQMAAKIAEWLSNK